MTVIKTPTHQDFEEGLGPELTANLFNVADANEIRLYFSDDDFKTESFVDSEVYNAILETLAGTNEQVIKITLKNEMVDENRNPLKLPWLTADNKIETGYKLRVSRSTQITQETRFDQSSPFDPKRHERAYDKLTRIAQEHTARADEHSVDIAELERKIEEDVSSDIDTKVSAAVDPVSKKADDNETRSKDNAGDIATNLASVNEIKADLVKINSRSRLVPFYFVANLVEHAVGDGTTSKRTSLQLQQLRDNSGPVRTGQVGEIPVVNKTGFYVDVEYYHGTTKETVQYTDTNDHEHVEALPGAVWFTREFKEERELKKNQRQYVCWAEVPFGTTRVDDEDLGRSTPLPIRGYYPLAPSEASGGGTGEATLEQVGEKVEEYIANAISDLTLDVPVKPANIKGTFTLNSTERTSGSSTNPTKTEIVILPETKMLNRDGSVAYITADKPFITRYQSTTMKFDIEDPAEKKTELLIKLKTKHTFKNKAETADLFDFTNVKEETFSIGQSETKGLHFSSFADSVSVVKSGMTITDSGGTTRTLTKEFINSTPTFITLTLEVENRSKTQVSNDRTIDYELINPDIWYRQHRNAISLSEEGISDADRAAIDSIPALKAKKDMILRRFYQFIKGSSVALNTGADVTYHVAHGNFLETVQVPLTIDGRNVRFTFKTNPVESSTGTVDSGENWYYIDVYLPVDRPTVDGTVVETEPVYRVLGVTEAGDKDTITSLESKVAGLLSGDSFDPDALHYVDRVPRHIFVQRAVDGFKDVPASASTKYLPYIGNIENEFFKTEKITRGGQETFKVVFNPDNLPSAFYLSGSITVHTSADNNVEGDLRVIPLNSGSTSIASARPVNFDLADGETKTFTEINESPGSSIFPNTDDDFVVAIVGSTGTGLSYDVSLSLVIDTEKFDFKVVGTLPHLSNLIYLSKTYADSPRSYVENYMLPATPYSSSNPYPENEARPESKGYPQGAYEWLPVKRKGAITVEEFWGDTDFSEGHSHGNPSVDRGKVLHQLHGIGLIKFRLNENNEVEMWIPEQLYYDTLRDKNFKAWVESGGKIIPEYSYEDASIRKESDPQEGRIVRSAEIPYRTIGKYQVGWVDDENNGDYDLKFRPREAVSIHLGLTITISAQNTETTILARGWVASAWVNIGTVIIPPGGTVGHIQGRLNFPSSDASQGNTSAINITPTAPVESVSLRVQEGNPSGTHPDDFDPTDSANEEVVECRLWSSDNESTTPNDTIDMSPDSNTFVLDGAITIRKFVSAAISGANNISNFTALLGRGNIDVQPVLKEAPMYFIFGPYDHGWQPIDIYSSEKLREVQRQLALQAVQIMGNRADIDRLSRSVQGSFELSDELLDPTEGTSIKETTPYIPNVGNTSANASQVNIPETFGETVLWTTSSSGGRGGNAFGSLTAKKDFTLKIEVSIRHTKALNIGSGGQVLGVYIPKATGSETNLRAGITRLGTLGLSGSGAGTTAYVTYATVGIKKGDIINDLLLFTNDGSNAAGEISISWIFTATSNDARITYHLTKKRFLTTPYANIPFPPHTYKLKTNDYDSDGAVDANESDRAILNFGFDNTSQSDGSVLYGCIPNAISDTLPKLGGAIDFNPFAGTDYILMRVAPGGNSAWVEVGMKRGVYDHLENQNKVPDSTVSLTTDGILYMVLTNVGASATSTEDKKNRDHEFEISRYSTYYRDGIQYQLARGHLPSRSAVLAFVVLVDGTTSEGRMSAQWKTYAANSHPNIGFGKMRWHDALQNTDYDVEITEEDLIKKNQDQIIDALKASFSSQAAIQALRKL